jgi:hypothetical protein
LSQTTRCKSVDTRARPARPPLTLATIAAGTLAPAATLMAGHALASSPVTPPAEIDCRLGYTMVQHYPDYYPVTTIRRLHAGQYLNFALDATPTHPDGMEFIQVVRMHQTKTGTAWNDPYVVPYTYTLYPDRTAIAQVVQDHPGSLWLLGNEIDRRDWPGASGRTFRQDEMCLSCTPSLSRSVYLDQER